MSGLTIELTGLSPGVNHVRLVSSPAELGLEPSEWPGPVVADLNVEKSGDRVSIRGELEARAALACVRCLGACELPVRVPFEVFSERAGSAPRREEEELQRDRYIQFHNGRQIDLAEEAHDALLLEIPMAPHCREDCMGLCPHCGANLNEGPCGCSRPA